MLPTVDHPALNNAAMHVDVDSNEFYVCSKDVDDGRIRILTMNRKKSKNAFDDWMFLALADALNKAILDEKVLVVVITGNGKVGMNVSWLKTHK